MTENKWVTTKARQAVELALKTNPTVVMEVAEDGDDLRVTIEWKVGEKRYGPPGLLVPLAGPAHAAVEQYLCFACSQVVA